MIKITLNVVMAQRNISTGELAKMVGITPTNISILKTGKAKAIRFSTLEKICKVLKCQPGDILEYVDEESNPTTNLSDF
ncbi:MAG: helix-turn-helix transcriptional regulator [Lentilactobacillus buchneri]|nr:helix-turn-helix transcriptional regulator [Lentilactobacillus hilgardii]MCI1922997.1 helix-turn-helix transcriptional regulator [Lentilactobacillus buchneri]RRG12057.1 MAG: transcriptional regulator [Lactobacillus sp.]MCI1950205.1 helix-turn-helix transcriptional regulator [Lentilactobacillus buchneri]MCI2019431.1 helix-turn-helix transcriptional regulator [Lentilactobacillus buchneri]MCI2027433.1 helix-turn-helix transcriptional regulator [Lentilactobacillus buchneri]